MDWLSPAIMASLSSTIVLAVVYYFFYHQEKEAFLGIWAAAWSMYSFDLVLQLIGRYFDSSIVKTLFVPPVVASGLLLLWGAYAIHKSKLPRYWVHISIAICVIYFVTAPLPLPIWLITLPSMAFIGIICFVTGFVILRELKKSGISAWVAGLSFIALGIINSTGPFVLANTVLATISFNSAWIMKLFIAFGMIGVYFELNRRRLEANTMQMNFFAEHTNDIVYRLRLVPSLEFEFVSPSIERFTGYPLQSFYDDAQLAFVLMREQDRELIMERISANRDIELPAIVQVLHRNGSRFWLELKGIGVYDEQGNLVGLQGVGRDLTDMVAMENQLQDNSRALKLKNDELQDLNSRLMRFNDSVGNDLKAPLWRINALCQLLSDEISDSGTEVQSNLLKKVELNCRKMSSFINNMFRLSTLDSRSLQHDVVNVSLLAETWIQDYMRDNAGFVINGDIQNDVLVKGDKELIKTLLSNILGNSVKNSKTGSDVRIRLAAKLHKDRYTICIKDDGSGFASEMSERIFEPFMTANWPSEYEGAGLGLTIARRIVDAHGGKIWAESSPGNGAEFCFTLKSATRAKA